MGLVFLASPFALSTFPLSERMNLRVNWNKILRPFTLINISKEKLLI